MTIDEGQFKNLLKKKGLKVTNQRVMVLSVLSKHPGAHMTTEQIYDLVKIEYPEIGLTTVYRILQLLLELELIDKVNLDDGYIRYEIRSNSGDKAKHHHHHLVCVECGKVISFNDDMLDRLENKIKETMDFDVVDHEVKFYGYCSQCKGRAAH